MTDKAESHPHSDGGARVSWPEKTRVEMKLLCQQQGSHWAESVFQREVR